MYLPIAPRTLKTPKTLIREQEAKEARIAELVSSPLKHLTEDNLDPLPLPHFDFKFVESLKFNEQIMHKQKYKEEKLRIEAENLRRHEIR
jgi:hypothetical protein